MMAIGPYTEKELKELRDMRKRITNPGARWLEKPTDKPVHRQRSFKAKSEQDESLLFEIFQRQNIQTSKTFLVGLPFCRLEDHA